MSDCICHFLFSIKRMQKQRIYFLVYEGYNEGKATGSKLF